MQATEIQRALKLLGFDPGPIDGDIGLQTKKAIRAFQIKQSLPVSGVVDVATERALQAAIEEKKPPVEPAPPAAPAVQTLPSPPKLQTQSAGMIGAYVVIASSVLGAFGIAVSKPEIEAWSEVLAQLIPLAITLAGGITAAIGRYRARAPISGGPADPMVQAEARFMAAAQPKRRSF